MTVPSTPAASRRVLRTHIPERAGQIGVSVRAADRSLRLDGGGHGLLDTTHFDTVCFARDETEWHAATEAMVESLIALGKEQGLA